MAGYPSRITRSSLGPTLRNAAKVRNPETNVTAELLNLLSWQTAGMNGLTPRVLQVCTISGGVLTKGRKWLAWDQDGALPASAIDVVRSGAGVYTWALASSSYNDMNGNAVAVGLDLVFAFPMGTTNLNMIGDVNANGYQGTLNAYTADSGVAADPAKFAFLVF